METLTLAQVKPTFDYLLSNWIDAADSYISYRTDIQQSCITNVDRLNDELNTVLTLRGTMNFCKGKVAGYLTGIQQFLSDEDNQTLYSEYQYKIKDIHESLDALPDFGMLGHICDD